MNTEYSNLDHVVFVHNHRFNILITERHVDEGSIGMQFPVAHYIVPQTWTNDDCYEYAEGVIEEAARTGNLSIEHRVVG